MADFKTLMRAAGFRATKPRILFLETLAASEKPLSVADIAGALKRKVDFVTVYRIAESFERAGLITRVDLRAGKAFYEFADQDHHHHHIVCTGCGTVEDIEVCVPDSLTNNVTKQSKSFSNITSHALEFFGTCKSCIYA